MNTPVPIDTPLDLVTKAPDIGRISIKASAGTGKTYSLTVLAVQYVAERGITPDQLLMVTYTREATSELRAKTRERAQEALDTLRNNVEVDASSWMNRMASAENRNTSITRLAEFLARFDEVTVSTIHGFCQNVLRRGGLSSPAPANFTVVPNVDHIVDQVVTDRLIEVLADNPRKFIGEQHPTPKNEDLNSKAVASTVSKMREAVKRVLGNQGSLIFPQRYGEFAMQQPPIGTENQLRALAHALDISDEVNTLVAMVHDRCKRDNILTYDDLVRFVANALCPPDNASSNIVATATALATSIAGQYSVIMVDEFQDTDAAQWSIFKAIHQAGTGTLITVGDPKQAIYRFRGADVNVYLDAVDGAEFKYSLSVNRRSDKPLLDAIEVLLTGQTFDLEKRVPFDKVLSDPEKRTGYFTPSLEIRYVESHDALGQFIDYRDKLKFNNGKRVSDHFMTDMANEIVQLLHSGIHIPDKKAATPGDTRPLRPKDIAVLVHGHADAEMAVAALAQAKVPAVRLKTGSVFESHAAMHFLMLLGALAQPGKPAQARAFGLSWFGGLQIEDLVGEQQERVADLQRQCAQLSLDLRHQGITGVYLQFRNNSTFLERILSLPDGERIITDCDHIAEVLASHPRFIAHAGAAECFEILTDLVHDIDTENDEQKRRIETDEDSVVVMTMHTSKGLQFPIVFLPTAHKAKSTRGANPLMFPYNFGTGTQRIIDVASGFDNAKKWFFAPTPDVNYDIERDSQDKTKTNPKRGRKVRADLDAREDRRRLLYVALTRAEHKLIAYFSPLSTSSDTGNLEEPWPSVLATAAQLDILPITAAELDAAMNTIVSKSVNGDSIATISATRLPVNPITPLTLQPLQQGKNASPVNRRVATFTRNPYSVSVRGFKRWSYSGITRLVKGEKGADETAPVVVIVADESESVPEVLSGKLAIDESNDAINDVRVIQSFDGKPQSRDRMPMVDIPGSAALGNLVHELLDTLDPSSPHLADIVLADVQRRLALWGSDIDAHQLATGIVGAMNTPVAPHTNDTVVSLGQQHRLSEMSFDFRLPENSPFSLSAIGKALLLDTSLPPEIHAHAQSLADPSFDAVPIAGYMTGSIDAVFRITVDGQTKFLVSDYKTNKVHSDDDPEPLLAYHPHNLASAMVRDGYILQALIYTVALQRYLRSRLPDYNYATHIAGVSYLFVRGMIGETTSDSLHYGVFFWQPAQVTIDALDALFAEGTR